MTLTGNDAFEPREVAREFCNDCENDFVIYEIPILGGDKKGELMRYKKGCICEDIALAKETSLIYTRMQERKRLEEFEKLSLIPPKLKSASFKSYKPQNESQMIAKQEMMKYVKSFNKEDGFNVALVGDNGVGKSHLAVATIKELIQKDYSAVFVSVPRLLSKIRDTYNSKTQYTEIQYLEMLEKVDILVLDDIGIDKTSDWASEKIFLICDARQGLNTIFTTSKTSKEIFELYGKDNFSRMGCTEDNSFKMTGRDMRR